MPSSEYTSVPSTGKLKLKGGLPGNDSKINKKKKKSKDKDKVKESSSSAKVEGEREDSGGDGSGSNNTKLSALEKALRDEDKELAAEGGDSDRELWKSRGKTEAEKRWEEQRRKKLDERLRREGVKSHKERVEELNRYLSGLTEHHDMPRIGPG